MGSEINRGYLAYVRRLGGISDTRWWPKVKYRALYGWPTQLAFLPLLFAASPLLMLRLRLSLKSSEQGNDVWPHSEALTYIQEYSEQYPMHLYPLIAKAFELAYLKSRLPEMISREDKIVEVAIGDGTLSRRVFSSDYHVTGVEINPYSLVKSVRLPHLRRAIVGDGLNPPLRAGSFDLLVSNNFLHHVSRKRQTIHNWAKIANRLVFNENTRYWATSWTVPYILRKLGFVGLAEAAADNIEAHTLQDLETLETIGAHVSASCDIIDQTSFFSAQTFFYASIFSFLMRCFGPPTPPVLKKLFVGPLRPVVLPLTAKLGELLIRFDAAQDRSTDTFVVFSCRSKNYSPDKQTDDLVCPRCHGTLSSENRCTQCGRSYPVIDGMLFLLPEEFSHVVDDYDSSKAAAVGDEQH